MVQNNQKSFFMLFWGILGHFGPKKIQKGLQLGGMFGPMSELKNKPLTKSLGLLF
jgi:hypothetical protein